MLYFLCYKQLYTMCSPVLCNSFSIKGILVLILMKKKKCFFFQTLSSDNLTKRNMWYFTMFSKYTTLEVLLCLKLDLQGSFYIKTFYYKKSLKLLCLHVLSCSVSELNCLSIPFLSEASVDNIIFLSVSYDMSLLYLSAPLNTFIILIPCRDIKPGKCRYILMKYNQTTFFSSVFRTWI